MASVKFIRHRCIDEVLEQVSDDYVGHIGWVMDNPIFSTAGLYRSVMADPERLGAIVSRCVTKIARFPLGEVQDASGGLGWQWDDGLIVTWIPDDHTFSEIGRYLLMTREDFNLRKQRHGHMD